MKTAAVISAILFSASLCLAAVLGAIRLCQPQGPQYIVID
jgi:hypothetical protein